MSKDELFKRYKINDSHSEWDNTIDSWNFVEVYREMHNGELPPQDGSDTDTRYITDFLDKANENKDGYFFGLKNPGSLYLTAKRMVYRYAEEIVKSNAAQPRKES